MLALLTIENVAVTGAAVGIYAVAVGRRRLGLCLIAIVTAYLLLLMRITFPWLSEGGYVFGDRLYGDFARSERDAIACLVRPDHLFGRLATAVNGRYLLGLLLPVGFLPLASPLVLALAAQLPLNMVSSWPYAHEIRYHYVAPIIPFVFLAVVRTLAACPPRSWSRRLALATLVAGIGAGQYLYSSPWLLPREGQRWWRGRALDARERTETLGLLARVPSAASVSTHYRFLPALCQRTRVFMFPQTGPAGSLPDVLLLEKTRLSSNPAEMSAFQNARRVGDYFVLGETSTGTILLFRGVRVRPPRAAPGATSTPSSRHRSSSDAG